MFGFWIKKVSPLSIVADGEGYLVMRNAAVRSAKQINCACNQVIMHAEIAGPSW